MKERVGAFIGKTRVLGSSSYRGLTVFSVVSEGAKKFPYLVMDEALKQGKLKIGEVGTGGNVPELVVENGSGNRVFLMDGEEMVGAKQNRILNTSIMVEVGAKIRIPVSCVEQGRWRQESQYMDIGGIAFSELRSKKSIHVSENLKAQKSYASDQSAVWNSVQDKIGQCDVNSPTSSMKDVFHAKQGLINEYLRNLKKVDGSTGVVAVVGNRIVCADLFDCEETLARLWDKLIASYALDAIECDLRKVIFDSAMINNGYVKSFLDRPLSATFSAFDSPGIGKDVRFEGNGCAGSCLICEDTVIHMAIFQSDNPKGNSATPLSRPSRRSRGSGEPFNGGIIE